MLDHLAVAPPAPVRWRFRFSGAPHLTLCWSGGGSEGKWKVLPGLEAADVDIGVEPRVLAGMVFEPERSAEWLSQVQLEGDASQVFAFMSVISTLSAAVRKDGPHEPPDGGPVLRR